MLFLQKLAQEANSEAETGKENVIEKRHIKAALEVRVSQNCEPSLSTLIILL